VITQRLIAIRCALSLVALSVAPAIRAQTAPPAKPSIAGAWTLNKDLSDAPRDRGDQGDDRSRARRGGGGYGRGGGGGYGRGGGRGGGMGRGGSGGGATMDPEQMARMREAMRDLTEPSDHLTIVQTDSMVVITSADGRTTRLSPDGKKIKDDNTKIERRTKWDSGRLVSEISGLGPAKATQVFAVDPDSHQLRITVQIEGGGARGGQSQARSVTHVYDADQR